MATFVSYHVIGQSDKYFFHRLKKGLDMFSKFYERYMLTGDFNAEKSEPQAASFSHERKKYCKGT